MNTKIQNRNNAYDLLSGIYINLWAEIIKKISFMLILFLCLVIKASAQWHEAFLYNRDWSSWRKTDGNISHYNDESGIVLKTSGGITYFRFQITNYTPPTKKQLKAHLKTGEWFEYVGTVEYCVNDQYPDAKALAKASSFVIPNPRLDETPTVTRRTNCIIKIQPYKKLPANYNVYFDGIGVGIDISGISFQGEKKYRHKGRVFANIVQSVLLFPVGIGSWWWNPVRTTR